MKGESSLTAASVAAAVVSNIWFLYHLSTLVPILLFFVFRPSRLHTTISPSGPHGSVDLMSDLSELVETELRSQQANEEVLTMWRDIFRWYNEGGRTVIEENLDQRIREIASKFTKEMKEIQMGSKIKKSRRATAKKRGR